MNSTDNRDLLLDQNNNLVIVNGDFQFSKGVAGVVQECRIKLSMFRGEWFLNRAVGISFWQEILGRKPERAIAAITSEFYQALTSVEDVIDVIRLAVEYDGATRTIGVRWAVKTRFGDSAVQSIQID